MLRFRIIALVLLSTTTTFAETKVPPIAPRINGTFPKGGQRGTSVDIVIKGANLQDAKSIRFQSSKLRAEVLSVNPYEITAKVHIDPTAEPGRHDLRLINAHGSAIGYFDVSTFPERKEKEPNNDAAHAESLTFPSLINGVLTAADYDFYSFDAREGQVLTFDILATRNGSMTDAAISILDKDGEELAYSDDYYGFKDPHLVHRFDKAGKYTLRVMGSSEAGCDTCDYRLFAGEMPFVDLAMPAGGKRGSTVTFTLRGVNLSGLRDVTLGDGLAHGKVLSATSTEAKVSMRVPDAAPGVYRLHAGGAALPVPFVISTVNEVTVADGRARNPKDPVPVNLPVIANGIFSEAKAADHFVFRVDEPTSIVLETEAMQLGYLSDPLVAVYDDTGKRIAYQDDPTTNTGKEPANMDPHLVVQLPKAGRYTALVRDAQFRGDPAFLYRLSIKKAVPDFALRTIGTDETLYRGRTNTILVRVRRLEGWNTPVEVWADNLPPGVHATKVIAEPKNTPYTGTCGETHYLDGTNVEMQITVDADAPLTLTGIQFRGRGVQDGRTVEHTSRARYFKSRIRHIGDAEEDDLRAVVADAPGVVLGVPRTLSLDKQQTASFTAIVTRLDEDAKAPLELSLEAAGEGLSMQPVSIPAASTRAEVAIKGTTAAVGEFVLVGRVNGNIVGKSHPITVRSKS